MRQRYRQSGYDRLNHLNRFEVKMPRVDESLLNTLLCFTTTDSLTWQRRLRWFGHVERAGGGALNEARELRVDG